MIPFEFIPFFTNGPIPPEKKSSEAEIIIIKIIDDLHQIAGTFIVTSSGRNYCKISTYILQYLIQINFTLMCEIIN